MTFDIRLKTSLLVSAEIRRCEGMFINAVVLHRGDEERGLILIMKSVPSKGAKLYAQNRDESDDLIWFQPLGEEWIDSKKADQYIARQRKFDEDLWVIEIEDAKDVYSPQF